jgi:hypothetical protein
MNNINSIAILQIASWNNARMDELEIRQLLVELCDNEVIKTGLKLTGLLNSIKSGSKKE